MQTITWRFASKEGTVTGMSNNPIITGCNWDGDTVSPTLTANNAGGNQRMPDKDNFNAVLQYAIQQQSEDDVNPEDCKEALPPNGTEPVVYPGVGITNKDNASNPMPGDAAPTVTTDSRNYMVGANSRCFQNTGRGWWNQTDIGATLRTPSGGGGDGAINANVVCTIAETERTSDEDICYQNYTGGGVAATLDASYYKGSGARNGTEREFIAIREGEKTEGPPRSEEPPPDVPAPVVTTVSPSDPVKQEKPPRKYIVRRLMPIECARLQGFPDWWCDGADGSDSAQYKMWGNGIALPCAEDVLGRIAQELRNAGKEE